jgi:hypothetical protein
MKTPAESTASRVFPTYRPEVKRDPPCTEFALGSRKAHVSGALLPATKDRFMRDDLGRENVSREEWISRAGRISGVSSSPRDAMFARSRGRR